MITYKSDGVTLVDGAGNTSTPMDGQRYSDLLEVMDRQIAAASANTAALSNYNTQLSNAQISINAGREATAPPKPLQVVVSDAGAVTYVPFIPSLPDLTPAPPAQGSTAGGVPVAPTVDKQAIMYSMVLAIYKKLVG